MKTRHNDQHPIYGDRIAEREPDFVSTPAVIDAALEVLELTAAELLKEHRGW